MAQTENGGRERILARIRSALRETAPQHAAPPSRGPIFAPIGDPLARFQKECLLNGTECLITPDSRASAAALAQVLASVPPGEVFVQDAPALRRMAQLWQAGREVKWSTEAGPAESSQATITCAEVLVAETGSIFVSSACGGRGASIVAPVHIVLATADQLVADLDAAFASLRNQRASVSKSMLCLITGSSRTADIEKIIVLGAHGPRRLVLILALEPDPSRRQ